MTPGEQLRFLDRSDERDMYEARILAAERRGYERGLEVGRDQGLNAAYRDYADWCAIHPLPAIGPSQAALERRYLREGRLLASMSSVR
jgi:hypothetical protein